MINLYNTCSLHAMRRMEDNQYDLAIVDPPYGVTKGMIKKQSIPKSSKYRSVNDDLYNEVINWNIAPGDEYFIQLRRVSKNQIVWGGNYFPQLWKEPCRGFIFWDKRQVSRLHADGEMAWTSFDQNAKQYRFRYCGNHYGTGQMGERIHPTQKPPELYYWLLENWSKPGQKILDTHLGSGSIAIACHDYGVSLDGYEINKKYYEKALERVKVHQSQLTLGIL